jgi:hypothetical protein
MVFERRSQIIESRKLMPRTKTKAALVIAIIKAIYNPSNSYTQSQIAY